MTESGFLNRRRRSPVSLGAAFAIQGVILAGLITMAPKIVPKDDKPFIAFNFRDPITEPPPPMRAPKPETEAPDSRVDTVTPLAPADDTPFVVKRLPDIDLGSGPIIGTDTGPIVTPDPPKATPIFKGAEVDPRYAQSLQPAYPGRMQRQGTEGAVTVKILVGTDGRVKQVQQVAADDPSFYRATEEQALARWRFRPATRDGVPVESWRTMTVRFKMES